MGSFGGGGSMKFGREMRFRRNLNSCLSYDKARHYVGWVLQHNTYNEWLPALFGKFTGSVYGSGSNGIYQSGYSADPPLSSFYYSAWTPGDVHNIFSTATFRLHTSVNHTMAQVGGGSSLELDQTFFEGCIWFGGGPGCRANGNAPFTGDDASDQLVSQLGTILTGQTSQVAKGLTNIMLTEQRNQLFYKGVGGPSVSLATRGGIIYQADEAGNEGIGQDLVSWNVGRGRDHGIQAYITVVKAYFGNQSAQGSSAAIRKVFGFNGSSGPQNASAVGSASRINAGYGQRSEASTYTRLDLWVGMLMEAKINSASMLGPTLAVDNMHQFRDTRNGDRFYYQNCNNGSISSGVRCGSPGQFHSNSFSWLHSTLLNGSSSNQGSGTTKNGGNTGNSYFRAGRQGYRSYSSISSSAAGNRKNFGDICRGFKNFNKNMCGAQKCSGKSGAGGVYVG